MIIQKELNNKFDLLPIRLEKNGNDLIIWSANGANQKYIKWEWLDNMMQDVLSRSFND